MILFAGALVMLCGCAQTDHFSDDPTAEKFYKQGTTLMQQGYYDKAIPPLNEAIEHDQHFVAAFINRAKCKNEIRDYQGALEDGESAVKWNPESSYAFFQKAKAEEGLQKFVDAANDYQSAAKCEPEGAYCYSDSAAKCYELSGQPEKARELRAKLSEASDATTLLSRGLLELRKQELSEAKKDFTAAITQDPAMMDAYYNRAQCESLLGEHTKALDDLNKVIEGRPDVAQAYYTRGWVKMDLADYDGAAEDFKHHVTINDVGEAHSPYSVMLCALAYRKAQNPRAGDYMLGWWQPNETKMWPYPVLRFLRGEITGKDLLSAADTNDRMTEAKTYLGMQQSIEGKTKEAVENLSWVRGNGNRSFSEYQLALSELGRMPH
jgi:tetratricopeptide (TPR) repeat protein